MNRISQLDFIQDNQHISLKEGDTKNIHIEDIWEQFKIRFTLFDPLYEEGDQMWMKPDSKSGYQSL